MKITSRIFLVLLSVLLSISYSHAQVSRTITITTPGSLETALGSNKNTITDLTVSGNLNASDFNTIRGMSKLAKLDISKSDVESNKIPDNAFANTSLNSIILPSTITNIGRGAFAKSNIKSMKIPEAVTRFEDQAFEFANITGIDFSSCKNLTYIGSIAFNELKTDLDMTSFTALETIGVHCFVNSNITKTFIPRTVKNIDRGAFRNCAQLAEITSANPTPPQLGSSVFDGVNKQTCVLLVPKGSVELYTSASQWQDFLYIHEIGSTPTNFDKVDLNFKVNIIGGGEPVIVESKGIRIGEYYWSDVLDIDIPYLQDGTAHVYSRPAPTQELFELYIAQIHIEGAKYEPSIADFNKYYGQYYDQFTANYINKNGNMREVREGGNVVDVKDWILPNNKDFRQLFAMCPFHAIDNTYLDEVDVRSALSYKNGEIPLAYDIYSTNVLRTYWFEEGVNTNMYRFNMTPSGMRLHNGYADWGNGLAFDDNKDYAKDAVLRNSTERIKETVKYEDGSISYIEKWRGPDNAFAGTFYTYSSWSKEQEESGNVSITKILLHDRVDTGEYENYFSSPMRWCRRLTNEELGYKLYIKVKDINTQSYEWKRLSGGVRDDIRDEIVLLREVKKGTYSPSDFDIIKLDLNTPTPAGYTELPNGYIRGFYVQYILSNPNADKSISDIVLYASRVDDKSLDLPKEKAQLLELDSPTTRQAAMEESKISVYPNPAENVLYIDSTDNIQSVKVYNTTGSIVLSVNSLNGNSIDVSGLPSGMYVVRVQTEGNNYTQKVFKK